MKIWNVNGERHGFDILLMDTRFVALTEISESFEVENLENP